MNQEIERLKRLVEDERDVQASIELLPLLKRGNEIPFRRKCVEVWYKALVKQAIEVAFQRDPKLGGRVLSPEKISRLFGRAFALWAGSLTGELHSAFFRQFDVGRLYQKPFLHQAPGEWKFYPDKMWEMKAVGIELRNLISQVHTSRLVMANVFILWLDDYLAPGPFFPALVCPKELISETVWTY